MLASSPIPKQTVGRTFFIAIITLGVAAAIQIGAVGWAFIARFHATSKEPHISLRGLPSTENPKQAKFTDPFAQENPGQAASMPKPTPINTETLAPPVSPTQGRLNELVAQAKMLRDRGDMSTALTRLREALALAPEDPGILSELATTYEKMGVNDKALEIWRRIYSMGKAAGAYYALASDKLNPAVTKTEDDNVPKADNEGFQTGSVLALVDITKTDSEDAPGKKFKLNIPLKSRTGAEIDVHDVVIQVFFYEQLDDQSVVLTNSNVVSKWITTPVDWSQNNIQILEVEYSAASLTSKEKHPENRKYFGYIVRVYYKGSLQDMRAEPVKLLQQYPPPLTLSNEDAR
jgi:tetratricopeptide (TPR) repeat protein